MLTDRFHCHNIETYCVIQRLRFQIQVNVFAIYLEPVTILDKYFSEWDEPRLEHAPGDEDGMSDLGPDYFDIICRKYAKLTIQL